LNPTAARFSRRKRVVFAAAAIALTLLVTFAGLLATDIYLHRKYERSAGFNIWGYRGPAAGRKQPGEYRVAAKAPRNGKCFPFPLHPGQIAARRQQAAAR